MKKKVREIMLPFGLVLSILVVVVSGSLAWGEIQSRIELLEIQVLAQGKTLEKVNRIAISQEVLKEKVDGLVAKQSEFREDTKDALRRIERLLFNRGSGR